MRIKELAKKYNTTALDVLHVARAKGVEATSALTRLDPAGVKVIEGVLMTRKPTAKADTSVFEAKREKARAARLAAASAEKNELAGFQTRAREIEARTSKRAAKKAEAAPAAPVAQAAEAPVAQTPAEKPAASAEKPAAQVETKAADKAPAKQTAKAAPAEKPVPEVSLKAEDFGSFAPMPPASGNSRVIFHKAEEIEDSDDEIDDLTLNRSSRSYDYDDDAEDDLTRAYLGGRSQQQSTKYSATRQKDDSRDEFSRDRNDRGDRFSRGQASRPGQQNQRPGQQNQRFGQQNQRPGQQNQRFGQQNGRPQAQPFPTRPQAQPFPTRPQAGQRQGQMPGGRQGQMQQGQRMNGRQGQMQQGQRPGQTQNGIPRGIQRGQQPQFGHQGGKGMKGAPQKPVQNAPAGPSAQAIAAAPLAGARTISLRGPTLVRELAEMMGVRPNKLIADLMLHKVLVSINQRVEYDMACRIAEQYGYRVELERARRSSERKPAIKRLDEEDDIPEDRPEDMKPRPPVVTFLGHVDHGKTSLLDYIRKSKVASGEAGGITQHIGAYTVEVNDRAITFLDTPGHAAFSAMRARGAKLTDIAVIVVAADDGIMPQTREVIKECRQANVQIMVAINKCDLPAAKPDRVRQQLQGEGLTPEEWGGDIVCCEVSAHTGAGMDNLLEMILLQADVLELQANPNRRADGYVIEAQMELGLGPTATLLVASGTLNLGDVVLIDEFLGRLRGLIDDRGRKVKSVGPAQAVRVMGLSGVPEAGAEFRVMKSEKRAKELAEKFALERKASELEKIQKTVSIDSLLDKLSEQKKKQLNVIIKADTQGTVEAICDTLRDIRSEKISLEILGSAIGNINANDVQRAAAGNAMIVGFQVNSESGVAAIATHDGVRINTFRIIYELFDFVKQSLLDLLDPEYREVVRGHAQIRQIFDIGKKGKIAGCQLLDGVVRKDALVRVKRARDVLFDGKISSLKHYKDEVSEVRDMQEFGISFVDFEQFSEGDVIECYAMEEMERTL